MKKMTRRHVGVSVSIYQFYTFHLCSKMHFKSCLALKVNTFTTVTPFQSTVTIRCHARSFNYCFCLVLSMVMSTPNLSQMIYQIQLIVPKAWGSIYFRNFSFHSLLQFLRWMARFYKPWVHLDHFWLNIVPTSAWPI